ncbi:unnamed protein product [Spirodela intermedia]|uniref:Uncharacterized protein n=1 Tax=Spirodela intermedia TaxID=51605 RepID=A0A7I8IVN0_SPIIN|nr:unnamed protein product [Spirodela intermedia]CAA6662048.1 unnamed protein product [Spirodela intermedia]
MQCPNCRKIEKGNWLYANGCRSYPDTSVDEWTHDEDLYDLNYSEMPPCGLCRTASCSVIGHSCPYVAYFPLQHSASQPATDGTDDAPIFHHHWGSLSGRSDLQSSRPFPVVDLHYRNWEPHSPPYSVPNGRIGGAEPAAGPPAAMRPTRLNSDGHLRPGSFLPPFLIGHGSPAAAASAVSMGQSYHGGSRGQPRTQELHPAYQRRSAPGPQSMMSGVQRSVSTRNMAPPALPPPPPPPPSDHSRFYLGRFYAWERDRFTPFPLMQVDRDSTWWRPFPTAATSLEAGSRAGILQWHGSESPSLQGRPDGPSHRSAQPPQMHPL